MGTLYSYYTPLISHWISLLWCVCVCVGREIGILFSIIHAMCCAVLGTVDTGATSWLSTYCSMYQSIMSYHVTWSVMGTSHDISHPHLRPLTWLCDGVFKRHWLPHLRDTPCLLHGCFGFRTAAYHAHSCSCLLLVEPFSFPHSLWDGGGEGGGNKIWFNKREVMSEEAEKKVDLCYSVDEDRRGEYRG